MSCSPAGRNAALSGGLASAAALAGLNIGDPGNGTTAAGELAGGAYARVAVSFGAPSSGTATAPQVTINVPAGSSGVDHFSLFTSGGAYLCGGPLSASESYGAAGTYGLTPSLAATG